MSGLWNRRRSLAALLLLVHGVLVAQDLSIPLPQSVANEAEALETAARQAIREENYERALDLLTRAESEYPGLAVFPRILGDLYFQKELYELALEEYQRAHEAGSGHFATMRAIAVTLGRLNREHESVAAWERLVSEFPDRVDPIHNLGWMYFKVHQLEAGEALLLAGIEEFGIDADLAMTLGTVYADMYQLEKSEYYYRRAIDLADTAGDDGFVSVSYYNLSLVEKAFYRFNSALESTNRSLTYARRPTGYLARGELHELRMDYNAALRDYMQSYGLDEDTPLPQINLAALYQRFGVLDAARAHIEEVYRNSDLTWLYNFGTDQRRHLMEVHEILADTYDGLAAEARLTPAVGLIPRARRFLDRVVFWIRGRYHRMRFHAYARDVATSLLEEGRLLDGYWTFYEANESYRRIAREYLERARSIETAVIPQTQAAYQVELGRLERDWGLLADALPKLSTPWENDVREQALRGILATARGLNESERAGVAAELYLLNPGAIRQHGLRLPVRLSVNALAEVPGRSARLLDRYLLRAGLERSSASTALQLRVEIGGDGATYLLYRPGDRDQLLRRGEVSMAPDTGREQAATTAAQIARELLRPQS